MSASFAVLVACGGTGTNTDAGTDPTVDAGSGSSHTVTSSGTVDAIDAKLLHGYARLNSDGSVLFILSSEDPFVCPASPAMFAPRPNQAGVDILLTPSAGGTAIGTFPFSSTVKPGTALGFAFRGPATCPADVGDGLLMTSGSLTVMSTTGGLTGTFTATLTGGEQLSAEFVLPFCNIGGITGTCTP